MNCKLCLREFLLTINELHGKATREMQCVALRYGNITIMPTNVGNSRKTLVFQFMRASAIHDHSQFILKNKERKNYGKQ